MENEKIIKEFFIDYCEIIGLKIIRKDCDIRFIKFIKGCSSLLYSLGYKICINEKHELFLESIKTHETVEKFDFWRFLKNGNN